MDTAIIDNPDWRPDLHGEKAFPRKITAQVNYRESAIATMAQKGLLDAPQIMAADHFRKLWERREGSGGAKAFDYTREPVDCSAGLHDPITVSQLNAGRELRRARLHIGEYGYNLVRLVAGERRSLHEICGSRRERESTADHLRIDLTALAQMWGLQTNRSRR